MIVPANQQRFAPTTARPAAAIAIRQLGMVYRNGANEQAVLRQLDLEIEAGESVILAGPSGSGKSTLLSIIGCMLTPTSGSIHLLGKNATRLTADQRTEFRLRRIGFIFQRFNLIRGLTALENVCIPFSLRNMNRDQARREARQLLRLVGLEEFENSLSNRLSGGQCQRVAIARALANRPDIILADEPTASLDAETGNRIMELLTALTRERGTTLLTVTHDQRIFPFARRILHLESGQIAAATDMTGNQTIQTALT